MPPSETEWANKGIEGRVCKAATGWVWLGWRGELYHAALTSIPCPKKKCNSAQRQKKCRSRGSGIGSTPAREYHSTQGKRLLDAGYIRCLPSQKLFNATSAQSWYIFSLRINIGLSEATFVACSSNFLQKGATLFMTIVRRSYLSQMAANHLLLGLVFIIGIRDVSACKY